MKNLLRLCLAAAILAAQPALAETVKLGESAEQPPVDPPRGMTMDAVREHYGNPLERVPPVGRPPISRWVYQDSIVYFEHNRVLHSVKRHPR